MAAFGGNESCPNCNARMAADQRYCLNCGHRRGDPRLPFMDAVVFMESMNAPGGTGGAATPPPPPAQSGDNNRWNANAALIAGVATLVLAIGVGFLIGRSGHDNSPQAQAPQVIKVEGGTGGGGGGEETVTPGTEESSETKSGAGKSKAKKKSGGKSALNAENTGKATKKAEANSQEGDHGATEGVEKVLHTAGDVELETEVEVGGKCKDSAAGCEGGEFTGNFFGE